MKKTAYGKPLFLSNEHEVTPLTKNESLDERTVQELILRNPECLPISEIDESYNPIIPVCKELNTTAGPLDILMVSPNGELTIIETKLWRNPEARRKVVAQILDYAKELPSWTYEDLQREINRRLGKKGNTLYKIVQSTNSELAPPEADFVDTVNRNLERGKFLLLIVGDGIREGAIGITEFLSNVGHLNFAFAMIELSLYKAKDLGTLIIPKTIVKTTEISKMTVEIPQGFILSKSDDTENNSSLTMAESPQREKERKFYLDFWNELINELSFDDPGQPMPKKIDHQNLYVHPGKSKQARISAYFSKSSKRVGVYFAILKGEEGETMFSALSDYEESIKQELGENIKWNWNDEKTISIHLPCDDVFASENRDEIKKFFNSWLNTFVNVMRPKLKKIIL